MLKKILIMYHLTLSIAVLGQEAKYFAPEIFPANVSGAVCGFSPDGRLMYFAREDSVTSQIYLYQVEYGEEEMRNEKLLPFSGSSSDMGGRLSSDGLSFYFTSDRVGGSTDTSDVWNIWRADYENGSWSKAIPLSKLNEPGSQCCPTPIGQTVLFSTDDEKGEWQIYEWDGASQRAVDRLTDHSAWQWPSYFHQDFQILLFNSMKRPDSRGRDDIFYSFRTEEGWTAPRNMGDNINTTEYEDGAILTPDGSKLIFNRHDAQGPSRVMVIPWEKVKPIEP